MAACRFKTVRMPSALVCMGFPKNWEAYHTIAAEYTAHNGEFAGPVSDELRVALGDNPWPRVNPAHGDPLVDSSNFLQDFREWEMDLFCLGVIPEIMTPEALLQNRMYWPAAHDEKIQRPDMTQPPAVVLAIRADYKKETCKNQTSPADSSVENSATIP